MKTEHSKSSSDDLNYMKHSSRPFKCPSKEPESFKMLMLKLVSF
jgi:hypothetical protein